VSERTLHRVAEAEQRAIAAQQVLEHPALREAFERLSASYQSAFINSAPHEREDRENAYFRLRALEELRIDLESVVGGGRIMAHNARGTLRRTTGSPLKNNHP
jgi:hypothetical protein